MNKKNKLWKPNPFLPLQLSKLVWHVYSDRTEGPGLMTTWYWLETNRVTSRASGDGKLFWSKLCLREKSVSIQITNWQIEHRAIIGNKTAKNNHLNFFFRSWMALQWWHCMGLLVLSLWQAQSHGTWSKSQGVPALYVMYVSLTCIVYFIAISPTSNGQKIKLIGLRLASNKQKNSKFKSSNDNVQVKGELSCPREPPHLGTLLQRIIATRGAFALTTCLEELHPADGWSQKNLILRNAHPKPNSKNSNVLYP